MLLGQSKELLVRRILFEHVGGFQDELSERRRVDFLVFTGDEETREAEEIELVARIGLVPRGQKSVIEVECQMETAVHDVQLGRHVGHPVENESAKSEEGRTEQSRRRVHLGLGPVVHVESNVHKVLEHDRIRSTRLDLSQTRNELREI